MAFTGEQIEATAQLERARESLGEALGQTQDISDSGLDVEKISAALAKSVRNIFSVQSGGLVHPESPTNIHQAMSNLRETLMLLQDVADDAPGLERVTGTVARILALLYPVSKVLEKIEELRGKEPVEPKRRAENLPDKINGKDRRRATRHSIKVDIGIHSETNFFVGFSSDISSGGLFIATYDILRIGTELNVNFTLPKGPVLSLNGIVRWVREYNETTPDTAPGMGIQFENLNGNDRKAINYFIEKNPPIFYDDE